MQILTFQKETVILVHGTFAAPKSDSTQWYQPKSAFCNALDAQLAALGSSARTWRHVQGDQSIFSWSGRNSWPDRSLAAQAFAVYLQELISKGWTCHIVAHSHGGNILLHALHLILQPGNYTIEKYGLSNLVCLGTPFIPPLGRVPDKKRWSKIELIGSLTVITAIAILTRKFLVLSLPLLGWMWIPILLVWVIVMAFFSITFSLQEPLGGSTAEWKRLLVVTSQRDEVFQLLSHALRMTNPFGAVNKDAPPKSPGSFAAWFSALRNLVRESDRLRYPDRDLAGERRFGMPNRLFIVCLACATIIVIVLHTLWPEGTAGAALRYLMLFAILSFIGCASLLPGSMKALVCLPARFFHASRLFANALPGEIVARWFRKSGWDLLRQMALGTGGYPLDVQSTSLKPDFLNTDFYHFQELPNDVEREALDAREKSLAGGIAGFTEALTRPIATDELLQLFERNPSLIHASYYLYPECISIIAKWIARTDEVLEDQDPRGDWEVDETRENDDSESTNEKAVDK